MDRHDNIYSKVIDFPDVCTVYRAAHVGATGEFCSGPQPERGPRRPHEGPPEYLFKRSIYSNRAVRSKYSNRAVTVFFRVAVQQAYR